MASLPNASSNWTGCHYNGSDAIKTSTPHLYYWSKVWGFEWAALQMREFTQITKKYLPNAVSYDQQVETHTAVTAFYTV